jgi:hypothetical protein
MKRLLWLALMTAFFSVPSLAQGSLAGVNGDCTVGGQQALTQGLASTGTQQIGTTNILAGAGVQASFPNCSVTVYATGTSNKASIYSNNLVTPSPLSNPFTSNQDGSWTFFIATGACYDITISTGIGPSLPYSRTYADVCEGSGSSGTITGVTPGGFLFLTGTTVGLQACGIVGQVPTWNGLTWQCGTPGSGSVVSVSGTANEITVTNPTTTPQIFLANPGITPGDWTVGGNGFFNNNATVTGLLTGNGGITSGSITDTALTNGNCVQAGPGGLLTTVSSACGSSGGGITGSGTAGNFAGFTSAAVIANAPGTFTTSGGFNPTVTLEATNSSSFISALTLHPTTGGSNVDWILQDVAGTPGTGNFIYGALAGGSFGVNPGVDVGLSQSSFFSIQGYNGANEVLLAQLSAAGYWTQVSASGNVFTADRNTDTSPTGNFLQFLNAAANTTLFQVDVKGNTTLGAGATLTLPMAGTQCLEEVSGVVTATGSACGSGGGSSALSAITAATTTNTIANGNNGGQVWNWAQTSANQTAFTFGETTAAIGAGDQEVLVKTIAGSTAIPLTVINSLTGSQTSAALQITPTWNTTGVVDAALLINVTNAASGTGSLPLDVQIGNVSQWKVDKTGQTTQNGPVNVLTDGVHAGSVQLIGQTTVPALTTNTFSIIGPNSASFTAWGIQMPTAGPSVASLLKLSTLSSGVSQGSLITLQGTDSNVLTSGTLGGTGSVLCVDANAGAGTSGCNGLVSSGTLGEAYFNTNGGTGNITTGADGIDCSRMPGTNLDDQLNWCNAYAITTGVGIMNARAMGQPSNFITKEVEHGELVQPAVSAVTGSSPGAGTYFVSYVLNSPAISPSSASKENAVTVTGSQSIQVAPPTYPGSATTYSVYATATGVAGTGTVTVTGGTAVAWVSGTQFTTGGAWTNQTININGAYFKISSVSSATALTLTTAAANATGVQYSTGMWAEKLCSGATNVAIASSVNVTASCSGAAISTSNHPWGVVLWTPYAGAWTIAASANLGTDPITGNGNCAIKNFDQSSNENQFSIGEGTTFNVTSAGSATYAAGWCDDDNPKNQAGYIKHMGESFTAAANDTILEAEIEYRHLFDSSVMDFPSVVMNGNGTAPGILMWGVCCQSHGTGWHVESNGAAVEGVHIGRSTAGTSSGGVSNTTLYNMGSVHAAVTNSALVLDSGVLINFKIDGFYTEGPASVTCTQNLISVAPTIATTGPIEIDDSSIGGNCATVSGGNFASIAHTVQQFRMCNVSSGNFLSVLNYAPDTTKNYSIGVANRVAGCIELNTQNQPDQMTALNLTGPLAASTSALTITGAPYTAGTATTNFPNLYLNDGAAPTTFSTAGTEIGINAPSGFTGNLLDAHINGAGSVFSVSSTGAGTFGAAGGTPTISLLGSTSGTATIIGPAIAGTTTNPIAFSNAVQAPYYQTTTNCSSSASPAVCGAAAAGSVYIPTGTTSETLVVNTTAVTANSQIMFYPDDTLGTKLGVTCNSTLATLVGGSFISARTAGTSFTITFNGTILTNGVCGSYLIIN